jgi:hypothetical protein
VTSFAAPAPRAATGGPVDPSGLARLVALVFWAILPALSVAGIVLAVTTWTVHAHRQVPGIPGTFVVQNRSCGGSVCLATGTFASVDKTLQVGPLTGVAGWGQNSTHQVVFDPSSGSIVPLGARWNPTAAISALSGGVLLLGLWGWFALGRPASGARDLHHETTTGPALA